MFVAGLSSFLLLSCSDSESSASAARELAGPASTTTTSTTTTTTTTTIAPELETDGVARALVTETGVVLPVLETLDDEKWLVRTTCQALAIVTEGKPVDRVHVVLDPGHGGLEPGAVTSGGLSEASVNLAVARATGEQLEELGFVVLLTRYEDTRVPILTRVEIAERLDVDLLVSIHHQGTDPAPIADQPGTEVYYQQESADSKRFAGLLREEAIAELGLFGDAWFVGSDAGATYRANTDTGLDFYGMVRRPSMPAVLAEMSFLGHSVEVELLGTQEFVEAEARAITNATVRWFGSTDQGSGFVEPSFTLRSSGGGGTVDGCVDPDLGPTDDLPVDLDLGKYPSIDAEVDASAG